KGQKTAGDTFLAGLEEGQSAEVKGSLGVIKSHPLGTIGRKVQRLRVPCTELFCFLEEANRHRFPVQAATGNGRVPIAHEGGGQSPPSVVRTPARSPRLTDPRPRGDQRNSRGHPTARPTRREDDDFASGR